MKPFIVAFALLFTFSLQAQETIITGTLLGHDGKPMQQTNIHVYVAGKPATTSVQADNEGSFKFTTTDTGVVMVKFAGLFHLSEDLVFRINQPSTIRIALQLGTYRFLPDPEKLTLAGSFNNWDWANPVEMVKERPGIYSAELETKDATVSYEVARSESGSRRINGTQADTFEYDGDGDYRSIIPTQPGKVKIVYDYAKLLRSDAAPKLAFVDPALPTAHYTMTHWEINRATKERNEALNKFLSSGADYSSFKYEANPATITSLAEKIKDERDPVLRSLLFSTYFMLASTKADPDLVTMYLREAPEKMAEASQSQGFSLMSGVVSAGQVLNYNDEFKRAFSDILDKTSNASVKGNMALSLLSALQSKKMEALYEPYYNLVAEKLTGSPYLSILKARFAPKVTLAKGQNVPAFSVPSLESATTLYSNESLKGKVYLLHFWATWSGPSVKEIAVLERVYESYKAKGFEILSLSLDTKPEVVKKFRAEKKKMPWLHAFITTEKKLLADFTVIAPPKFVLIDATGKITAMDNELTGEQLEQTLSRVLGQ